MESVGNRFRGWSLVIFGVVIGASVVVSTVIASNTAYYVKTFNTSLLTVTGSTEQLITSDQVKWMSSFTRETPPDQLKEGYAQMKKDAGLLTGYLESQGVASKDITLSPVTMTPIYEGCAAFTKPGFPAAATPGCENKLISYRLAQQVQVNSSDVNKIAQLARNASALVNQGVIFSTQGVEYYYSKLPGERVQLLELATKNAQLRAQKIAESTGAKVGHLVSVSTGVFQITPPNSTQISDYGVYDTSTIEKRITAVVRASFTLIQ